jgi:hypothetical protein
MKCCENTENITLRSFHILYMFVLRAKIVTIFEPKMVTIPARNTTCPFRYNGQVWELTKQKCLFYVFVGVYVNLCTVTVIEVFSYN